MWILPGCSTNNPRDLSYGTDVALDFVPPDAGPSADGAEAVEESGNSVDGSRSEVSQDSKVLDEVLEVLSEVSTDGLQGESVSDPDAAIAGAN